MIKQNLGLLIGGDEINGKVWLNENTNQVVIFSHGMGVDMYSRNLFLDIAEELSSQATLVFFEYNKFDGTDVLIPPLSVQVAIQTVVYRLVKQEIPNAKMYCVAHSQGCFVTAKAGLPYENTVFLAYPLVEDLSGAFKRKFTSKRGAVLDEKGVSILPRTDGLKSYFPFGFFQELDRFNCFEALRSYPSNRILVVANQDEVLGPLNYDSIEGVDLRAIDADHNFTGPARAELCQLLARELFQNEKMMV